MMHVLSKALFFVRAHLFLITVGICCEIIYLLYFVRRLPLLPYYQRLIDMGQIEKYTHTGMLLFVLAFTALFIFFGSAWWSVRFLSDRATLWLVLGFGALFALTMIFVYPATAIDIYNYIAQSLVLVRYHADPLVTPAAVFKDDPLIQLAGQWTNYSAPYGPLGILIDALPSLLSFHNLLLNLLLLKLVFSFTLLVEAFLVYKILIRLAPQLALMGTLFVAWNPHFLFEYSANGHNDVTVILFVLLAILALVHERPVLALVLVTASALVKYSTLPLLPLFFLYGVFHPARGQKRTEYIPLALALPLVLAIGLFVPFWRGSITLSTFSLQSQFDISSFDGMLSDVSAGQITPANGILWGRVIFGVCYLYALYLSTRTLKGMLRGYFLVMFFFLAFASGKFEIWYSIWAAPLAVLSGRKDETVSAFLFVYGAGLSAICYEFLLVWLGLTSNSWVLVNSLAYVVTFVPALLALFCLALRRGLARFERPSPAMSSPD